MARSKDCNWGLPDEGHHTYESAKLAVLMDIRDELKQLNRVMGCFRVQRMSDDIHRIDKRIAKNLPMRKQRKS